MLDPKKIYKLVTPDTKESFPDVKRVTIRRNVWDNYGLFVGSRKVLDDADKLHLMDRARELYPNAEIIDKTINAKAMKVKEVKQLLQDAGWQIGFCNWQTTVQDLSATLSCYTISKDDEQPVTIIIQEFLIGGHVVLFSPNTELNNLLK